MRNPNCKRLEEILRRTGLGSLWGVFEAEGIDDGVVDELADADLQKMGIEKMEDRKRIIVAIRETLGWVQRSPFVGPEMVEVEGEKKKGKEKRVGRFWVGKYAVTWGEWKEVREWAVKKGYEMEAGAGEGEKHPVTNVNWYSVVKWCNARSEKEGVEAAYYAEGEVYRSGEKDEVEIRGGSSGYRLPSKGEWEWAARGGVNGKGCEYSGSNDLGEVGWYDKNSGGKSHEVGTKMENELGIYDLTGNVWEWCFDAFSGASAAYRLSLGGSWFNAACNARMSWRRNVSLTALSNDNSGFRVVRSLVP